MVVFKQIQFGAICVKAPFGYNLSEEKNSLNFVPFTSHAHLQLMSTIKRLKFFMLGCCRINTLVFVCTVLKVYRPFNESKVCLSI